MSTTRIAVVGDVLLDVDLSGSADRLSPDAPVPVVAVQQADERAGGAGLVAALLARDGVDVTLVTVLGDDARADALRASLERTTSAPGAGSIDLVAGPSGAPTPVKTRVRGSGQAVVRLDENCDAPPAAVATPAMLSALEDVDAIVVADYGRGVAADPALRRALDRAAARVPLVWDPHPRGEVPVAGSAVVTPNAAEALAAAGLPGSGVGPAHDAAAVLAGRWGCDAVLVTLGHHGALLHVPGRSPEVPHVVPAAAVHDVDTCGAGDRLAASLAVALAGGRPLAEAVAHAVQSAGRFLAEGGVSALSQPANTRTLGGAADGALTVAHSTRSRGGTVVATGGCFDLLHAGHARTLAAARALGDCLIVCLNSDDSVRRLKGSERPIMSQGDRVDLLLALECVDAVIVFDEDTPETVLRRVVPDIWVKGGDYVADELPETAVLAEWGGRTVTVPYVAGRSSTRLAGALARVG
jgi:rfaE bifunctional protein nucleotidyltransferase chain/domain/rfaE bifunctional protein kinase chain/domain